MYINDKEVVVPSWYTVLQACRQAGYTVPTFCYHDRLSIAGNCRMCIVEVKGWLKPQIACSLPVSKNMKVFTNSQVTLTAQEGVLEFLLINHPLDCPICDQGGECDLQDLSMRFGSDRSRYTDIHFSGKRAVENLNLGPLIATEMTRCIHCTRCIRFASQVCGLDVLGTSGRGTDMLVGTYVDKMFMSEMSGNVIDLCPVGALTSAPYSFRARPWELKRTNSIDVMDATGTNIVINSSCDRVLRILPREHDEINQEWLSDKGRWAFDSLEIQRLVTPMVKIQGCLTAVEWNCGLRTASDYLRGTNSDKLMAIAGPYCNAETLVAAKDLLNVLGSEHTYIERDLQYSTTSADLRCGYLLNVNMQDVAKADKILLIGTNPRYEAPILNSWIRQAYMFNECDIYYAGISTSFNYFVNCLGSDIEYARTVLKDKTFTSANHPLILVGARQLEGPEAGAVMNVVHSIASSLKAEEGWGIVSVIPREASWAGALEAGWKPGAVRAIKKVCPDVLLLLGADQVMCEDLPPPNCKVIYVGFQGTHGACYADVILPGAAYTESGGIYLNMEGRSQYAFPAVTAPGKARSDWKIMRALAEYSGVCLFYYDHDSMLCRMSQISPNFAYLGNYQPKVFCELPPKMLLEGSAQGKHLHLDMKYLPDYYCGEIYTCNSRTMIKARAAAMIAASSSYCKV